MLLNCGVGEDSWESLEQQGDPTSPFQRRSVLGVHGRTDAEAEAPIHWSPDAKSWLIAKHPYTGKIEGRRRSRQQRMRSLDGIWLNGHEFEQALEDSKGKGSLVCCIHDVAELDISDWAKNITHLYNFVSEAISSKLFMYKLGFMKVHASDDFMGIRYSYSFTIC